MIDTVVGILVFAILAWWGLEYIRLKRRVVYIYTLLKNKMDCDALIDDLLEEDICEGAVAMQQKKEAVSPHRDRLAALAVGGQARRYLGKSITANQVDEMDDEEIEKLYTRYEARLGAAMTKTLGQAFLQMYTGMASMFLPIPPENQPKLIADLEADPFVEHALSSATCELYHRYGMYLAPLTAALTTARHCQFEHVSPQRIDEENVGGPRCSREGRGDAREGGREGDGDAREGGG